MILYQMLVGSSERVLIIEDMIQIWTNKERKMTIKRKNNNEKEIIIYISLIIYKYKENETS